MDVYGITLGFRLGDNPNLDVRIPLSAAHFDVEGVDDTGFVGGIEVFPHYRINQYIAWGVRFAHNTSHSDFPIFDESMTNVNFETMAESSPAYGMNWSGRLSIGRYFPSNEVNDDAFWLLRGGLGLHYHLHDNFTMLPFFRYNYATESGGSSKKGVLDQVDGVRSRIFIHAQCALEFQLRYRWYWTSQNHRGEHGVLLQHEG